MSGLDIFNRIRRFRQNTREQVCRGRQNNEEEVRRQKKKRPCLEKDVSLRRLVNPMDNKTDEKKDGKQSITKYFAKGSPSITQEIDYLFEVSILSLFFLFLYVECFKTSTQQFSDTQ